MIRHFACRNLANSKVDLIRGSAKFNEKGNVEVDGKEVLAKNILIAVGGKPLIPDIPGTYLMLKKYACMS